MGEEMRHAGPTPLSEFPRTYAGKHTLDYFRAVAWQFSTLERIELAVCRVALRRRT